MVKKILVVDDSLLSRMALRKCLMSIGSFELKEAADGDQGLQVFSEFQPDITFLDLTMPKMHGFDALRLMKQRRPDAIIIIMTADAQKKTFEIALELGALMLLNKPPKQDSVLDAIKKAEAIMLDKQ